MLSHDYFFYCSLTLKGWFGVCVTPISELSNPNITIAVLLLRLLLYVLMSIYLRRDRE